MSLLVRTWKIEFSHRYLQFHRFTGGNLRETHRVSFKLAISKLGQGEE